MTRNRLGEFISDALLAGSPYQQEEIKGAQSVLTIHGALAGLFVLGSDSLNV